MQPLSFHRTNIKKVLTVTGIAVTGLLAVALSLNFNSIRYILTPKASGDIGIFEKVGIGVTNPQSKLEITTSVGQSGMDIVNTQLGNFPIFRVFSDVSKSEESKILEMKMTADARKFMTFNLGKYSNSSLRIHDFFWDDVNAKLFVSKMRVASTQTIPEIGSRAIGPLIKDNRFGIRPPCDFADYTYYRQRHPPTVYSKLCDDGGKQRWSSGPIIRWYDKNIIPQDTLAMIAVESYGEMNNNNRAGRLHFATAPGRMVGENSNTTRRNMLIFENGAVVIGFHNIDNDQFINAVDKPSNMLTVKGPVVAANYQEPSDERFKKNISPLENALEKLISLNGVSFEFKENNTQGIKFPVGKQFGVIAQEVEEVIPEVVMTDGAGYKSVEYGRLNALIVEAIKAQSGQLDQIESKLDKLN